MLRNVSTSALTLIPPRPATASRGQAQGAQHVGTIRGEDSHVASLAKNAKPRGGSHGVERRHWRAAPTPDGRDPDGFRLVTMRCASPSFIPTFTVGPGVSPGLPRRTAGEARGLYRRWGLAPRPEGEKPGEDTAHTAGASKRPPLPRGQRAQRAPPGPWGQRGSGRR